MRRSKAFVSSIIVFSLLIGVVVGLIYGVKYVCLAKEDTTMPIYKVDTKDKKIALTFDVAWGSENINYIMDVLDKYNIKSTFFLVGSWIDDNEDLTKDIFYRGHELGNHSNTHADLTSLSKDDAQDEIEYTTNKIYDLTGYKSSLYRPPFGTVDDDVMEICTDLGYQVIKWDVDSYDWKEIGPIHIVERVVKGAKSGSIILLHADVENVSDYLENIIVRLVSNGYELVPVSNLLYKNNYIIDSNGIQMLNK
jgi:polysaccharide deacetylase family sporulation protein PdaB